MRKANAKKSLFSCFILAALVITAAACSKLNTTGEGENSENGKYSGTQGEGMTTSETSAITEEIFTGISDIYYPPIDYSWSCGTGYPSLIMLQHSKNDNGTLLCTFEVWNAGYSIGVFNVYASTDQGASWKYRGSAVESFDTAIQAYFEPCIYELPEKIGEMEAGTILLAGCSIDSAQKIKTAIGVYKSTDSGKKWEQISVCDTGGAPEKGVWEPYLITDGKGTLYCFYTSAAVEGYGSAVVYRTTKDGVNWSGLSVVTRAPAPDDRTGMPVVTHMGNGRYFMVYEYIKSDNGVKDNDVYCKTSDSLDNWGDPDDPGTLVRSGLRHMGGAPVCAWTPEGSDCGTLVVTAVFMSGQENCDWFISHDYGETFKIIDNPLPYTGKVHNTGYRSSIFVSKDGKSLYYASSVDWTEDERAAAAKKAKISFTTVTVK